MLYFSRCPISAKILYLLEMFTSTVHNISHRPCTGTLQTYPKISVPLSVRCPPHSASLCIKRIAIGKVLKLSPPFPPLHTGHATFIAPGVPSNQLTTLHRGSTLYALAVHIVLTNFTYFCTSESSLIPFRLHSVVLGRY